MSCVLQGKIPIDADVVSPFVEASFGGIITVGNKSAPGMKPKHEAVIKSFEFGYSNGCTCELEILDEQGGMFESALGKLVKNYDKMVSDFSFTIKWGWVTAVCKSGDGGSVAGPITFTMSSLSATYDGGKIKFKVKGTDVHVAQSAARDPKTWGTDEQRIPLKEAIKKLWAARAPVTQVVFQNKDGTGEFEWEDDPKSVWQGDQQNRLAATLKWIEDFRTTNKRGTFIINDHTKPTPTIIIVESDSPPPCEKDQRLGTDVYLVHGGKKSNVITFSPTISFPTRWQAAKASGGFTGSPMNAKLERYEKCEPVDHDWVGIQATQSISRPAIHTWGTEAPEKLDKTHRAQQKANASGQGPNPTSVEAELKIQGTTEPKFWQPKLDPGQPIHVVVVNPFHIRAAGDGSCGDWLAQPTCNPSLTSKKWVIKTVSHSIREGSFTTTMKIFLPPQGSEGGGELASNTWLD